MINLSLIQSKKQCFGTVFYMLRNNEPFLPHIIIYPITYQAQIGVKKLKISIYSRKSIEKLLEKDFPKNAVVISFYDPPGKFRDAEYRPVDYTAKTNCVFQIALHDIDLAVLPKYHLTYETYFPEADDLAEFILTAKRKGKDIICQCEYGESRSSGCAAAIHEYFYKDGIKIFADYRYYPNQMVYHKVYDALKKYENENNVIRESGE